MCDIKRVVSFYRPVTKVIFVLQAGFIRDLSGVELNVLHVADMCARGSRIIDVATDQYGGSG
jgi:hypothetical protein